MSAEPDGSMGPSVRFGERRIPVLAGESVLEALERSGVEVPSGCRAGTCCKCMLRGDDPPAASQRNLRPTLRAEGFFLACQAHPEAELRLEASGERPFIETRVEGIETVAADVVRVFLRPEESFPYRPGQYLDVLHPSGATRSYSIASLPSDGHLELHVRRVPEGLVSGWIHGLEVGERVDVRGSFGQCFHVADDPGKKLLLVGAGTGLAPLLGIARDALGQGHSGPIDLIHGGLEPDRLYLKSELRELADAWPQLRVHHCVLRGSSGQEHEGPLDRVALRLAGPLGRARAFLCGDAQVVGLLQRSLFLAGLPSSEILADPFAPASASV